MYLLATKQQRKHNCIMKSILLTFGACQVLFWTLDGALINKINWIAAHANLIELLGQKPFGLWWEMNPDLYHSWYS